MASNKTTNKTPQLVITPPTVVDDSPITMAARHQSYSRSILSGPSVSKEAKSSSVLESAASPTPLSAKVDNTSPEPQNTSKPIAQADDNCNESQKSDGQKKMSRRRKILFAALGLVMGLGIIAMVVALHLVKKDKDRVLVDLGYATYRGRRIDDGRVDTYLGMRFAAPPTGDRRWRAPKEALVEGGVMDASQFAPRCWPVSDHVISSQDGIYSEDCLFANVWTPSNATKSANLPVWVFIQGGGYNQNSNSNWEGTSAIKDSGYGLVFVTFNYRVGLWGFLAGHEVESDGNLNAGLLDQRMVLRWVQKHIAKFGGNPARVTISGVSAGAGSVALHLSAYGGRNENLFSAAISESIFFPTPPEVDKLEWQFSRLLSAVGCDPTSNTEDGENPMPMNMGFMGVETTVEEGHGEKLLRHVDAGDKEKILLQKSNERESFSRETVGKKIGDKSPMQCLRHTDLETLQKMGNKASPYPGRGNISPLFYWTPVLDNDFIPDLPYNLFNQGKFVRVPTLFGWCTDEGSLFAANATTSDEMLSFLSSNVPNISPSHHASLLGLYPKLPAVPRHEEWFPSTSQAYGESTFICPAINIMSAISSNYYHNSSSSSSDGGSGSSSNNNNTDINNNNNTNKDSSPPVYGYHFAIQDPEFTAMGIGVPHVAEAGAVYGIDSVKEALVAPSLRVGGENHGLVSLMRMYFASFVMAGGDPNRFRLEGSLEWGTWGGGGDIKRGDAGGGKDGHADEGVRGGVSDNEQEEGEREGLEGNVVANKGEVLVVGDGIGEGEEQVGGQKYIEFSAQGVKMKDLYSDRCGFWKRITGVDL